MKRIFLLLGILSLTSCGNPFADTRLLVHLRLNAPNPNLRIADATTIALMQANNVLRVRLSLLNPGSNQAVQSREFDVAEGSGLLENVPAGTFFLRAEGLDLAANTIFIDSLGVTIQSGKENATSMALDPIPAITTIAIKLNGAVLELTGKRFTDSVTATIDGQPVTINVRTSALIQLSIANVATGQHTVVLINKPGKTETQVSSPFTK